MVNPPPLWVNVPILPQQLLGRDVLVEDLVRKLRTTAAAAVALHGLPGVGKSGLALVLARHPDVLGHFCDGVLFGGLGPDADGNRVLSSWGAALGVAAFKDYTEAADRARLVSNHIGLRRLLLIIDDAWSLEAARLLRDSSGPNCVCLLTTRDLRVARGFAPAEDCLSVPELDDETSLAFLQRLAPESCAVDPEAIPGLVRATGGLPLALELVGGFLADPAQNLFPELAATAIGEMSDPARRLQLASRRLGSPDGQPVPLREIISLSLEGVQPPVRAIFAMLGVFAPKPASFDLEAAKAVTRAAAVDLAALVIRGLVEREGTTRLKLHQVINEVALADLARDATVYHSPRRLLQ